ncbi:MAG: phenylalanine--tRNA ligase subunit beta [Candidatus Hydrogenedentes bacterium]|nr:phenylalanine--tRNA ligase subunit beta [Candidatus Hydrogenedentota bacterium]
MRISLNWLKEYIDIPVSAEELAAKMVMLGIGVEAIERPGADIKNVVVGQILSIDAHPDAEKLVVCRTNVGSGEPLQIVCGAKNMKAGDKVPTAVVGATLPGGFEIGRRKMRGIESFGMMCSAKELGMGDDHSGLLILDANAPIGMSATELLGLDDTILEIEITPNRGDWAGLIGVARELSALFHTKLRLPDTGLVEITQKASERSSVTIENPELCRRYVGRVLTDARIEPSPDWMKRRLVAAGQRPINNVVDITNYVLLETGHPLHAFDLMKLAENRIVVRTAKAGETIETIDKQVRNLTEDMLVIADADRPVAVAGVMGGLESEVGDTTTEIFLESAWFDPKSVRKTARSLGMQTEASQRFQRGADIKMAAYAANRATQLIQELAGAKVLSGSLDEYPDPIAEKKLELRYNRTNVVIGSEIEPAVQRSALEDLGFNVINTGQTSCAVSVPTWRCDVTKEIDLIEEVARLYGYGNINTTLPRIRPSEKTFAPTEEAIRTLRRNLVNQGLTEVITMTFSSLAATTRSGLPDSYLQMVSLQNPLSENHATMRSSLIPGLLETASRNARHGASGIAAFEIGPVFAPGANGGLPGQSQRLGIVLGGTPTAKHWSRAEQTLDFYDLKGYLEHVAALFALPCAFEHRNLGPFQSGQSVALLDEGSQVLAWMGMLRKDLQSEFDLGFPVYLAELNLDTLLARQTPPARFASIPVFPPSLRDIAVVVDDAVPAGDLQTAVREAGGNLLRRTHLIDVYKGKQIPDGKKSVALALLFQSDERTLTDQDTQKSVDRIVRKLQTDYKAELR